MRKNIRLIITIIALVFTLSLLCTSVKAGVVSTVEATEVTNGVKVTGTTAADVNAVAIAVYNEAGTKLVTMVTTSVNDSNEYSETITLANGTYVVKVADYAGGDFVTKTITIGATSEETNTTEENTVAEDTNTAIETAKTPGTGDVIAIYAVILAVAVVGFIVTTKLGRKYFKK